MTEDPTPTIEHTATGVRVQIDDGKVYVNCYGEKESEVVARAMKQWKARRELWKG